jgi:hypothetical protein
VTKRRHGARCYYNCPLPVASVTALPSAVSVPADTLGSVTIHWRWDQSSTQVVTRHGLTRSPSRDSSSWRRRSWLGFRSSGPVMASVHRR